MATMYFQIDKAMKFKKMPDNEPAPKFYENLCSKIAGKQLKQKLSYLRHGSRVN